MKILLSILVCLTLATHAQAQYETLNPLLSKEPSVVSFLSGRLGHPLGTYLTIEGVRDESGKVGNYTLLVDTVNDQKLIKPIGVPISNIHRAGLPKNTRCVIRGYESGQMIGVPFNVAKAEQLDIPQAGWQFYRYFIVTSVLKPESLLFEKDE